MIEPLTLDTISQWVPVAVTARPGHTAQIPDVAGVGIVFGEDGIYVDLIDDANHSVHRAGPFSRPPKPSTIAALERTLYAPFN